MSRLTKAWRSSRFYRHWTAQRLPHVLVIGTQKGGTSALFNYLAQHPRLAASTEKEVDFFGSDMRYSYGTEWYASNWPRKTPLTALRFEASPQYLYSPKAPARIQQHLPRVRLIAILRDPVMRAYSSWQMVRQQVRKDPDFYRTLYRTRYTSDEIAAIEPRTIEELNDFQLAIEREVKSLEVGRSMEWSLLELGLYAQQLARYFARFPREQILVLDSNDLWTERVRTMNRVLAFLGLPAWNWQNANLNDVFVGQWKAPMPQRAWDFLREYYRDSNAQLVAMLEKPPLFASEERRRASA